MYQNEFIDVLQQEYGWSYKAGFVLWSITDNPQDLTRRQIVALGDLWREYDISYVLYKNRDFLLSHGYDERYVNPDQIEEILSKKFQIFNLGNGNMLVQSNIMK